MQQSTITFYGGAGTVTGSNFMLDTGGAKFLVDCGMQQGSHKDEEKNWVPFAYDAKEVSHLIVTHAHIDHIGRIPWLVKQGFAGTILSTAATRALAEPMLHDAFKLLDMKEADTPYTPVHIEKALSLWKVAQYGEDVALADGCTVALHDAGHILGSAMATITRNGRTVLFSGDIGGGNSPLLPHIDTLPKAQYVLLESVYGDRVRQDEDRRERLENVIEDSAGRGGTLLIPAFSTERTQDLLYEIKTLMSEKRVPAMPVYVDSPLASKVTAVFIQELGKGDIFSFPGLKFIETTEESRALEHAPNPKIILAGSGMSTGGRVIAHERWVLPDNKSTLLIVGYQAAGSVGRRLLEGAKTVDLHHEPVKVGAKVEAIFGYSAHRDGEGLLELVNKSSDGIEKVFVVEGEPASAAFLTQRIRDYLSVDAVAPSAGEQAVINL
ncbi:MBL fold metallo-hydrolase [Candidatus Nomurabacteria bacterium]|nr:MBL fold metallo-hydrolase [Candidatus Nomurabacteria bacterium]